MDKLRINKKIMPDKHWIKYLNENGDRKHLDLSGSANNFERATGYQSQDDLRAVGWHYVEGGKLAMSCSTSGISSSGFPQSPAL